MFFFLKRLFTLIIILSRHDLNNKKAFKWSLEWFLLSVLCGIYTPLCKLFFDGIFLFYKYVL